MGLMRQRARSAPEPPVGGAQEYMTTIEVMYYLGMRTFRGAAGWCRKWGVEAHSRLPGPGGFNLYPRDAVYAAKLRSDAQGQGYRGDLICQYCGKGRPHNVPVHRLNSPGMPSVWACDACDPREDA